MFTLILFFVNINLSFQETEVKDLSEHKDKYIDILMQGVIMYHTKLLSKEPFQHESLLVDRKEKKLSSAEKRLAQRGYGIQKTFNLSKNRHKKKNKKN